MPKGQRAQDQTQISISLPKDLLAEIDDLAEADERSRSKWIILQLKKHVENARKTSGAHGNTPTAGDAVWKAPSNLPAQSVPTGTVINPHLSSTGAHSLNEEAPGRKQASGPRARSTRPGIAKTLKKEGKE